MAELTSEKQSFVEEIGKLAAADMRRSGVLASLTIAQAILESGWGLSGLAVKGCALFGIKATKSWQGKVYNADTQECFDGASMTTVNAAFRAYESWQESVADHSALLTGNARYAAVVGEKDYIKACHAIKDAGYATDPQYPEKLIGNIEQYGLTAYDGGTETEGECTMTEQEKRFREIVVSTARSYLGSSEGGAKHKEIIDGYNADKPLPRSYAVTYKDAWCATFVSFIGIKSGAKSIIPKECSCTRMIALFVGMNRWEENDAYVPSPGDIIFYDWQDSGVGDNRGQPDHVGIVEKVENGQISVLEGNYSDTVKRRVIAVNGRYIRGYGLPDYASLCVGGDAPATAQTETPAVMRAGATVSYTGPIYKTSDGTGKGRNVSGTFTAKYYSPNKKCGVHLDDLGWVSEYACNVVA